jgi:flagellar hook-associated protein 3 FlgL
MPSAVRPSNVPRVTMLMQTNLLMNNIRTNSVDLLKVQNQLTTGLKLSRPSDSPADASTIMHLDGVLENQGQYLKNISYATDYLASTDTALGQIVELSTEAHTLALGSIGTSTDDAGRRSNALMIDQIIQQLISIGNQTSRGSYLFAGQKTTEAPFESYEGGVLFTGDLSDSQTRVAQYNLMNFNINSNETFGVLSSEVQGIADLNPDITTSTLLSDLNGALNQGVRLGSIIVSDGTNTDTIDLGNCVTVNDVINKINNETAATTTVAIAADGTSMQITSTLGAADIMVAEVGTGYTARDLGIHDTTGAGATLTGQDVDARLSLTTPVTALAGGAGIDTTNGLKISNSYLSDVDPIDISTAQTLGDILNIINNSGAGVRSEINAESDGINILNQFSGSRMYIGEDGGTTATDLGIRSLTNTTSLSELNGGEGVATTNDSGDGIIQITARDGNTYDINISTAETVQDVLDLINTDCGGHITAALTAIDNGIELTDTVSGAGDLGVTTISDNGYFIAQQLGFYEDNDDGLSAASDTLTGADANPIMPEGLFSHLIALRDAMLSNDDAAMMAADEALVGDRENISNMHGMVGSMMRTVDDRQMHMEDNILATETLRSDLRDIDFTEAITRYQNLYTALQANLTSGGMLSNISLLDFLV